MIKVRDFIAVSTNGRIDVGFDGLREIARGFLDGFDVVAEWTSASFRTMRRELIEMAPPNARVTWRRELDVCDDAFIDETLKAFKRIRSRGRYAVDGTESTDEVAKSREE